MVSAEGGFLLLAAAALLLLPLNWVLALAGAALWHELGHLAALFLLGGRVFRARLSPAGAELETDVSGWRELVCALAGPVFSLSLVLFLRKWPRLALCGTVQGLFNLLPVYPLDGGRAVAAVLEGLLPGRAPGVRRGLEACGVLLAMALILALPLAPGWKTALCVLLPCRILGKKPCKTRRTGVQ